MLLYKTSEQDSWSCLIMEWFQEQHKSIHRMKGFVSNEKGRLLFTWFCTEVMKFYKISFVLLFAFYINESDFAEKLLAVSTKCFPWGKQWCSSLLQIPKIVWFSLDETREFSLWGHKANWSSQRSVIPMRSPHSLLKHSQKSLGDLIGSHTMIHHHI